MAILFELILPFLWELLLQIVLEILAEFGVHCAKEVFERRPNPWFAAIGYVILGAIAGAISMLAAPALFISGHGAQIASLVITPILAGVAMNLVGAWRRQRGQDIVRLDRFAYGYLFALSMAVVRFFFAA
jgi:hypothetical protein